MTDGLRASARRVQDFLGPDFAVVELPAGTRSAAEAAAAIGCTVPQIAKSIIFRAQESDEAVLVISCGVNRVDERKVTALLGQRVGKADADFVRQKTGYAIGGVPPVAHAEPPRLFIDEDLLDFEQIWAAAGTPFAVFALTPAQLVALTNGVVANVKK